MKKNPILRTCFNFDFFSEPMQLIYLFNLKKINFNFFLKIKKLKKNLKLKNEMKKKIEKNISKFAKMKINFFLFPLFKIKIIQNFENSEFYFLFAFHDSIMDGWSRAYFVKKLFSNFQGINKKDFENQFEKKIEQKNFEIEFEKKIEQNDFCFNNFVLFEKEILKKKEFKIFWKNELKNWKKDEIPHLKTFYRNSEWKKMNLVRSLIPSSHFSFSFFLSLFFHFFFFLFLLFLFLVFLFLFFSSVKTSLLVSRQKF